jgi:hypothetical protein
MDKQRLVHDIVWSLLALVQGADANFFGTCAHQITSQLVTEQRMWAIFVITHA